MDLNNVMISTCNRLDLETLGFRPIQPINLPKHCRGSLRKGQPSRIVSLAQAFKTLRFLCMCPQYKTQPPRQNNVNRDRLQHGYNYICITLGLHHRELFQVRTLLTTNRGRRFSPIILQEIEETKSLAFQFFILRLKSKGRRNLKQYFWKKATDSQRKFESNGNGNPNYG